MKHWDNYLHSIFIPYAEALDDYKNKLWNSGKPIGKRKAFVYTLNKTKITDTNNGKKIHKGNLLNWLVQGTIADVINQTSLDLINQEFNYLFPVHDSFYINANKSAIDSIINILNNRLQIIGLEMDSEIKIIN
jgi:archaellum component FlaF (FlaF/FlaG flagellin family)